MTERSREIHEAVISVVDDDQSVLDATRQLLRSAGYQVSTFASAIDFLSSEWVEKSGCLIVDMKMPGIGGLELQRRLFLAGASLPIVFISAHDDPGSKKQALRAGAVEFLSKPFAAGK